VALDRQGHIAGIGDMAAQAEQVFQNLQAADQYEDPSEANFSLSL
jgi:hypothetical protein